ncbi:MAG: Bax inhibitor-1/YccA family protein [Alphaproteobacteria bacterium]|nr:Bax inhibitor-1/YccA family protein [Alphaproteobacteria bacterium]
MERFDARSRSIDQAAVDEGLRNYMLRVYNYMGSGLLLTGIVAYFVARSGFYQAFTGPVFWVVALAPLGLVWFLSARIDRMSFASAQAAFWAYAALNGLSLSLIFVKYTGADITRAFVVAAAMFGAMSLYGYTTKKDLSGWGSFLFMGLIGIIIASIVNIFVGWSALSFAISVIGVLVFTGLTAYDTQQIKEMYYEGESHEAVGKLSLMGALRLYLDFLNLFLMLLSLFNSNRE